MKEFLESDSPYLCKEMLWNTTVVATVERVEGGHEVPIPNSSKTATKKVMFFTDKKLGLVLNEGHKKFLKRMFGGNDTHEWKGRRVLLYVEPSATYRGQTVGGIRMAIGDSWSGDEPQGKGPPAGSNPPPLDAEPDPDDYDRSA